MKLTFAKIVMFVGAIGVFTTGLWTWYWFAGPLYLPSTDKIVSIQIPQLIDVESHRELSFDVPSDHFAAVLAALQPANVDRHPANWVSLGTMEITTTNGETLLLWLYHTYQEVGAFSINGTSYRGGNSDELVRGLKEAFASLENKS